MENRARGRIGQKKTVEVVEKTGCSGGNCFDAFEWTEEDGGTRSYDDGFILQKKEPRRARKGPLHMESNQALQNESSGICSNTTQVGCERGRRALEDPVPLRKKRTYQEQASKKLVMQKIGEEQVKKVSLQRVQKWRAHRACVTQCLEVVSETEILDVRYDVWMNCKSCDDKVTWILQQLRTFTEPNAATGWIDFKFHVDGRSVCSAYYAQVLGYS